MHWGKDLQKAEVSQAASPFNASHPMLIDWFACAQVGLLTRNIVFQVGFAFHNRIADSLNPRVHCTRTGRQHV